MEDEDDCFNYYNVLRRIDLKKYSFKFPRYFPISLLPKNRERLIMNLFFRYYNLYGYLPN